MILGEISNRDIRHCYFSKSSWNFGDPHQWPLYYRETPYACYPLKPRHREIRHYRRDTLYSQGEPAELLLGGVERVAVDGYPVLLSGHPGLFEVGPQHHVVEGVVEGGQGVEGVVVKPHCGRVRRVRHLKVPASVSEPG